MKKIIFTFIISFLFVNFSFSQNNYNWITPNKTYLKLLVNDNGIYRINRSDFASAGVNTSGIDPRTVKVLYKGNEIPVHFQGEDDGSFDENDYIDFYGKRNFGGPTPHRNANSNANVYTIDEYYNQYSDTSIYWIGWDGSNGLRMQTSSFVSPDNISDTYFYKKVHFEKDNFYDLGETVNSNSDFRYFSTELVVGEGWFWKILDKDDRILTENVFIDNLSPSAQTCSLKVFIKPISYSISSSNEHRLEIKINNTTVVTLVSDSLRKIDTTITFSSSLLSNNTNNSVTFNYVPTLLPNYSPKVYIDFFILTYPRDFVIRNNGISINLSGTDSTSKKINVSGYNAGNQTNIYDIKNNIRIVGFSGSQGTLTFTGKSNSAFEIVNANITKKPFRIISRQVRDFVSATTAADYIIVYNRFFESQTEQLKNHRESFDNFRVVKADIEDLYDIFNYGIEDPVAVRNFVKYAYDSWKTPKVKYVCLMGRASLDPKRNDPSNQYYQNFVPTYGNPPTDGYFVNFNIGSFTYYHQIAIGRLPVYTTAEAQNAVDKIIAYDFQQPDKWWKKYIAITGGGYRAEQISFQQKSDGFISSYISGPPPCMQVSRIYRNDSTGYVTYNYKDSIKREFDRGALIVNFIGHAAAQDWEIGLENPNTLNNGGKQPLVLSFTCFTGKNAEPNLRSFGENFFLLPNKCAIGFVGTTGWSFSGSGNNFNQYMLQNFSDSARRIGEMVSYASKQSSRDSNSFSARNTINCYNLIGDPATKLAMPNSPEFDIRQNEYTLSNAFPALGELIKLSIFPKNLGINADSLRIRFQLRKDGIATLRKDTVINDFCYIDTLGYFFTIDTIANYSMSVILDPNRSYSQKFYNNDSITFPLTLRNLSYVPIKPLNNALLNGASFKFTGLNPNIDLRNNNVKLILQVDTSKGFDSPVLQTFNNSNLSGIISSFNVNLPVQVLNTVYFLKTNAIVNNDSSGWSEIQKAIYNPDVSADSKGIDSAYTIYTSKPEQFDEPDLSSVRYNGDGFVLNDFTGLLHVRSYGSNGPEASFLIVDNGINNIQYFSDGGGNQGLNIAKVKRTSGEVSVIKNFRMNSTSSSDSVLNFLNTFDSTEFLMSYLSSWVPDFDSIHQDTKNKFKEFGSVFADSILPRSSSLNLFDTWAFIGFLGADTSQTSEKFHRFSSNSIQEPLNCITNPVFQRTSGKISQTFGIADRWKNFSWEQELAPNSSITFDVYGIGDDNTATSLYTNLSSNSFVNLDTVDYFSYPYLRLDANLKIDTILGLESPVFRSTNFKYYPPAELIPDNYSFTGTDTVVQEGDTVSFSVNYYNVGFIDAPPHYNKWYVKNPQGIDIILKQDTVYDPLMIDSMSTSQIKFSTSGLRDGKVPSDTLDLYFESKLIGNRNELFDINNKAITQFVVQGDTLSPVMDITYDGAKIMNGDFVQSKPNIILKFYDDSRMVISDTSNVRVYISSNNSFIYVPYYINGTKNPEIDISFADNNFLQATVTYNPTLAAGEHKFRYVAVDVTGNFADSVVNTVLVDYKLQISDMENYPNPMQTETNFVFKLSGELSPTSCKVKIYTVAGRMIKEINSPAIVGYNQIPWNGTDNDGDYIANGTYLYKFIIQGSSQVETTIQKLVVLR
ncbi:MAG: C25 family cysteine peptidase [Bacteroidota bacterium]|nr:C25 family cysteine peptidase [Bacteroidota bacterium]